MYTLEKVLENMKMGADPYCVLLNDFGYLGEGWLSELDLQSDSKIEMYSCGADEIGRYLVLHLA